jgi:hypothetical protein
MYGVKLDIRMLKNNLYVAENIHEENKILGIHAFQNGLSSASCP